MDKMLALWILVTAGVAFGAQEVKEGRLVKRYGINLNLRDYPQATPKEALASVIAAIEQDRVSYLLAHLTDPEFVDNRVNETYGGNFDELVKETSKKLADNPAALKELRRFLREGEWQGGENTASAKVKDIPDRQVFMKKVGNRWFLENRQKAETPKAER